MACLDDKIGIDEFRADWAEAIANRQIDNRASTELYSLELPVTVAGLFKDRILNLLSGDGNDWIRGRTIDLFDASRGMEIDDKRSICVWM
ncbi:hypothetical protein WV31_00025 [Magnetospirillum sp. ME-1]|uniref:hypothetical protein n=1 Tax=Magnetospirillum sp. ME-1 TaxID=1639348 RepID=UPI000A17A301|nr:hypothetical protein [Magnetospirillum sp. ME-1]ARJ64203.1 hypothetical protein WV31_00025 [Magnetospirillum sp. ME-1]